MVRSGNVKAIKNLNLAPMRTQKSECGLSLWIGTRPLSCQHYFEYFKLFSARMEECVCVEGGQEAFRVVIHWPSLMLCKWVMSNSGPPNWQLQTSSHRHTRTHITAPTWFTQSGGLVIKTRLGWMCWQHSRTNSLSVFLASTLTIPNTELQSKTGDTYHFNSLARRHCVWYRKKRVCVLNRHADTRDSVDNRCAFVSDLYFLWFFHLSGTGRCKWRLAPCSISPRRRSVAMPPTHQKSLRCVTPPLGGSSWRAQVPPSLLASANTITTPGSFQMSREGVGGSCTGIREKEQFNHSRNYRYGRKARQYDAVDIAEYWSIIGFAVHAVILTTLTASFITARD